LKFLPYRFFIYLVNIRPRYFILFVTILQDVIFLISFTTPPPFFFKLILYLGTLLKVFISYSSLEKFFRQVDQWNWIQDLQINSHIYWCLVFDIKDKIIRWGKKRKHLQQMVLF
jgi:hypothetical protein